MLQSAHSHPRTRFTPGVLLVRAQHKPDDFSGGRAYSNENKHTRLAMALAGVAGHHRLQQTEGAYRLQGRNLQERQV
jgi:hypothetical protein